MAVKESMPRILAAARTTPMSRSRDRVKVLAARKIGSSSTQGDRDTVEKRERAAALSDKAGSRGPWLWVCLRVKAI